MHTGVSTDAPAVVRLDGAAVSLNAALAECSGPTLVLVEAPVALTDDLELSAGVALVFGGAGRVLGTQRLTGCGTRIEADAGRNLFAPEVDLAGTWDADFSPCWFGAVYDGRTDCTHAIQKCLDRGGVVRLRGRGTAVISESLVIQGGTWLQMDPAFTIRLADHACCAMLRTPWADQRYFEDEFPAFVSDPAFPGFAGEDDRPENWKLGEAERNIRVTGGTWDANGGANPRQDYRWGSFGYSGFLMAIINVKGFVLRDTTLYDANTYFFDAAVLSDFAIDNIHLDMRELRPNQDGIHLEGECYDGVVSNIHGRTWDDMVALNGGDSFYPKYPPGAPVPPRGTGSNVLWRSFLQGGIRNIMIRDIHVSEGMTGYRAVRLLSTGGHKIDAITIDGIYGRYAVDGVLISAHYESLALYGTLVVRNVACTVEGAPETAERGRRGLFWLENDRVRIDTLIIDGCRYRRTANNGQFLHAQGSIRRLFVSNVDIGIEEGAPRFGRGALACVGNGKVAVEEAFVSNLSIHAEGGTCCEIAFQGNWRCLHLVNASIAADTLFDLGEEPQAVVQTANLTVNGRRLDLAAAGG